MHGDLGTSLFYRLDVSTLIRDRLPPTLWLLLFAAVMSVLIAVPLAVLAASRPDGARDQVVRFVPMFGLGMPSFWVGIILLIVFALQPRAGTSRLAATATASPSTCTR